MKLYALMIVLAAPLAADPCVSPTFDRPLPNATGVETFVSDVPSAQFPAFWQTGTIDSYQYRLFSNQEGDLRSSDPNADWSVEIACHAESQSCDTTVKGQASSEALKVADDLGQCLLGKNIIEATAVPVSEDSIAIEPQEASQQPAPAKTPCGTQIVNEETDVATMQRLLILLGEDPGPVDGFLGPASFKAMDAFVEDANWHTSITDVIVLLDTLHCERSQ